MSINFYFCFDCLEELVKVESFWRWEYVRINRELHAFITASAVGLFTQLSANNSTLSSIEYGGSVFVYHSCTS